MGTGKLNIKKDFTEGYGDEPYVYLEMKNPDNFSLKIWEGLFSDLLDNPDLSGKGWKGFTRDYHEYEGIWNGNEEMVQIDVREYLKDIDNYMGQSFSYEETPIMVEALREFLIYADENGYQVSAQYLD